MCRVFYHSYFVSFAASFRLHSSGVEFVAHVQPQTAWSQVHDLLPHFWSPLLALICAADAAQTPRCFSSVPQGGVYCSSKPFHTWRCPFSLRSGFNLLAVMELEQKALIFWTMRLWELQKKVLIYCQLLKYARNYICLSVVSDSKFYTTVQIPLKLSVHA